MGNTFEVQVWGQHEGYDSGYSYRQHWSGESLVRAVWEWHKARKLGFGCVSLKWRG